MNRSLRNGEDECYYLYAASQFEVMMNPAVSLPPVQFY